MATKAKQATTPMPSEAVEVTPASEWKKPVAPVLTLPSGKAMKVRRAGIQTFVKTGIIPNSLMATVQSAIDKGSTKDLDLSEFIKDESKMDDMLTMIDNIVIFCAIEPEIHPTPTNDQGVESEDRDENLVYVDEVEDEDKMFIFQWATGGTDDVEQFRKESSDSLAALR